MSLSAILSPHIPYLRRFARALAGSQQAGDRYVAAVLETIVADVSIFSPQNDPKAQLYKIFLGIWQSMDINFQVDSGGTLGQRSEENLQAITPRARQAFLLTQVEGFTHEEAARILETDIAGCEALLEQASKDMAEQIATSVMIIEDEPLIAMDLEAMVEDLGHDVTGIARTHDEALSLFKERRPGIVLADIQLADGSSGIDAVNDILERVDVPVIFITAFPERLLTGERPEPAFLVTKPFQKQMLGALISQVLFFDDRADKHAA